MSNGINAELTETEVAMPSTGPSGCASRAGALDHLELAAVETQPEETPRAETEPATAPKGLYDRAMPLRLLSLRLLNYLTNHVVAHVPSFAVRRLWYQHALGIEFGPRASVFLGAYVWFNGRRDIRRHGVAIGENSRINRDCTLDIRCGLTIGDNVSISPEVMILGLSHDYNDPSFSDLDPGPITIEDYVWIGSRAMILPGVTLGRGAVVAAGSIVTKDVAPMTVVAGVPAKPVALRDSGALAYVIGWGERTPPLFE